MAIAADFSIDRATGNVRYTGTTANYTVEELYIWIRSLGDDLTAAGDDLFDITDADIAEKSFKTIIKLLGNTNIDELASQHLYAGSIIEADGTIYDGITVIAPQNTNVDIIMNGSKLTDFWGTGLNADSTKGISHKFMIKTVAAGVDIDNRVILGQTRMWGNDYQEFIINGTSRGENALPLNTKLDLNNASAIGTISALTSITAATGYVSYDVNADTVNENYYLEIDKASQSINDAYERFKWLTRSGTASTIGGLAGDLFRGVTHELTITDLASGAWTEATGITWATGTGQLLAIDNSISGSATKAYIQLLTGIAPVTDVVTNSLATGTTTAVVNRATTKPTIGSSTGTALIGGYGVVLNPAQLTASDKMTDLAGALVQPPNLQTGLVGKLIVGDAVMVAANDGSDDFLYNQFTLAIASTSGDTTVQINTTIPSDTPSTGTFRVFDGTNRIKVSYTGYATDTFTGCTNVPTALLGANTFITYIDEVVVSGTSAAFQYNYLSDKSLVCQMRNSADNIKTFKTSVTLGTGGFSINALRLAD